MVALGPEEVHQQGGVDLLLLLKNVILNIIVGAYGMVGWSDVRLWMSDRRLGSNKTVRGTLWGRGVGRKETMEDCRKARLKMINRF